MLDAVFKSNVYALFCQIFIIFYNFKLYTQHIVFLCFHFLDTYYYEMACLFLILYFAVEQFSVLTEQ